ncbi:hypothetical protein [Deinococcus arenicola]|uniref:Serine/threonine protein kinase n=1 Tax=Deinococcus arenicola TaxID=2994950 RepID=A0ABU4DLT5_9DEIO|nr:hypothetical protein [Deinococcus sp. ZS9-10]MDV6373397.1 hypothetical protein [Deinococcus sp. ZS9-10]
MPKVPHLKPLEQWICDSCGQIIEKPEDGWFELFRDADQRFVNFKIVHHSLASPLGEGGCYSPDVKGDMHLSEVLGPDGLTYLLSFIDLGIHHGPEAKTELHPDHIREWTDAVRRLHTPHFEEGRFVISDAMSAGDVDGHPLRPYTQKSLTRYIDEYNT